MALAILILFSSHFHFVRLYALFLCLELNNTTMNTDLINRLKTGIYASEDGRDLAQHLIDISSRNYHAESVEIRLRTSNIALGEVARALGISTTAPDGLAPYYSISVRPYDNVVVRVNGPVMAAKFDEA